MKLIILFIFSLNLLSQSILGQENKSKWQLNGNAGIYGDFYSMNSDTLGAIAARRPGSMIRVLADISLSYGAFSLPVSIMLTSGQYSVTLPKFPRKNIFDYIKDPSNRIGISPKYKWVQLLLGTQVPQYSELSVGDLPVFGAGINLTPGKFRFSFFAGTTQLAIEEDTLKHIQGIYSRKIYSGKIGYGSEEASHVYLISSIMKDDTSSLHSNPINTKPQKGVLSTIDYKLNFQKRFYIKGEIAGSAFTRDIRNKEGTSFEPLVNLPSQIFKIQESSRFDIASVLSVVKEGKSFNFKVTGKYIGDGFVPLGYPFMQTDRIEATIDPSFNLFKNKIQIAGSIGRRINNLSEARAATNTQTIASANLNCQFSEKLSLSASFTNFGFRNSLQNDTFRIEMLSFSWSINPMYAYTTASTIHSFTGMYSQNTFKDFNTISGALNDNDTRSIAISYVMSKVNTPFNLSGMFSYFHNNASFGSIITKSFNLSLGYKFLKKKLSSTAGITFNENKINSNDAGSLVMLTIGLKYKITKKIDFALNGSKNIFKYGIDRPNISYNENLLRTSVTFKF